ncbi:MAG: GspH/FimT family protein [Cyanobacteriota bacterium]
MNHEPGWTLPEALLALCVLTLLAAQVWRGGAEALALQGLETASQRLTGGLEEARASALRQGQPCGLRLGPAGWEAPQSSTLPACLGVSAGIGAGLKSGGAEPRLTHNLPDPVRFSANGLVLDGGTISLSSPHTPLVRCVVVSLPLGVTRVGRGGPSGCEPETTR